MLFVDFNPETDDEEGDMPNIHLIDDEMKDIQITEEQANAIYIAR